jgi:hypothetical protein
MPLLFAAHVHHWKNMRSEAGTAANAVDRLF